MRIILCVPLYKIRGKLRCSIGTILDWTGPRGTDTIMGTSNLAENNSNWSWPWSQPIDYDLFLIEQFINDLLNYIEHMSCVYNDNTYYMHIKVDMICSVWMKGGPQDHLLWRAQVWHWYYGYMTFWTLLSIALTAFIYEISHCRFGEHFMFSLSLKSQQAQGVSIHVVLEWGGKKKNIFLQLPTEKVLLELCPQNVRCAIYAAFIYSV